MKNVFIAVFFLCSGFLMAQEGTNMKEKITPPEKVLFTFQKEYPNKVPVWAMEYVGDDNDEIRYEAKFGKPSVVIRPGLGTIQVTYKADGEISKVDSKEGANVAVQVASIFNNLLDIIAPATAETPL